MKITETIYKQVEEEILLFIKCDKCKKEYDDPYEIQEFHHIDFVGGYGSIFGDMMHIEFDVCQHCLKTFIDGGYRKDDKVWIT